MFCPFCGRFIPDEEITRRWNMSSWKGGLTWTFKQWKCSKCKERGKGKGSFRTQEILE